MPTRPAKKPRIELIIVYKINPFFPLVFWDISNISSCLINKKTPDNIRLILNMKRKVSLSIFINPPNKAKGIETRIRGITIFQGIKLFQ